MLQLMLKICFAITENDFSYNFSSGGGGGGRVINIPNYALMAIIFVY